MGGNLEARLIRDAEQAVARQQVLIATIRANRGDTTTAEKLLAELEASLDELKRTAKLRSES